MHPILARRERLWAYLAAWIPLAAMLAYMLAATSPLTWIEASVLALPLAIVYAFQTLASWYVCRSAPPLKTTLPRLVVTHGLAAAVSSFLWVLGAVTLVSFAGMREGQEALPERLAPGLLTLFLFGVLMYLLVTALHAVLLSFESARQVERREMELTVLARDAELKALRAQLDPHFLFNSLNSVAALTTSDPLAAREMCVLFSDFLRRSLGLSEKVELPLGEELALARAFLAIERIRFGSRLAIEEKIGEGAELVSVPPLLLQPLVENAVKHGIATLTEGGAVTIEATRIGGVLVLSVENPFDADAGRTAGAGLGLANVRQRLAARYGERASLRHRAIDGRFGVELRLPVGDDR